MQSTLYQQALIEAMGKLFLWIRSASSEPAPGRVIAGHYVDFRKAENASVYRIPKNVPDAQKIAFALSDLAHNMADVASGQNDYFTADYFANECLRTADMAFKSPCWEMISSGLRQMAKTFQEKRDD
jgi:hypothetical protein